MRRGAYPRICSPFFLCVHGSEIGGQSDNKESRHSRDTLTVKSARKSYLDNARKVSPMLAVVQKCSSHGCSCGLGMGGFFCFSYFMLEH